MQTAVSPTEAVASPIALLCRGDAPHSDRAVRTGELATVMRGVYAERTAWQALPPWERYLARVHAAALRYPDAAFCGESGAALRGLPVFLEPAEVHVLLPAGSTSRVLSGIRNHTAERMPVVEEMGTLLVASAADIAVDIARTRHNAIGLAVAGAAMRADPGIDTELLTAINLTRSSSRGRRHARWVIERATPVPESPLEHVSLAAIEWLGFTLPDLQKWILGAAGGDDDRVDFWWPDTGVAGEADGDLKYSGTWGDAGSLLRTRRLRDARLLERGVTATAHWGWSDVVASRPLRAALLAAGLRPRFPEDTAQLRSLQRALTSRETAPVHRDS